jgi:hypothetical protein
MTAKQIEATSKGPDTILSLPDELLLHIADEVNGDDVSVSLRHLALLIVASDQLRTR